MSNANDYEELKTWDDLKCDMNILRGIYSIGFENPSPIQKKAIIPMNSGNDIIAQAQSGTGKNRLFFYLFINECRCFFKKYTSTYYITNT